MAAGAAAPCRGNDDAGTTELLAEGEGLGDDDMTGGGG